jgi:hypothetical protein
MASTIDGVVKSRKSTMNVIPANPGSGPGQAPVSRNIRWLQKHWTPAFAGVTTFYEFITIKGIIISRPPPGTNWMPADTLHSDITAASKNQISAQSID